MKQSGIFPGTPAADVEVCVCRVAAGCGRAAQGAGVQVDRLQPAILLKRLLLMCQ
jgi:hypothetical protein